LRQLALQRQSSGESGGAAAEDYDVLDHIR
jgi:hypothetical protein